VASWNLTLKRQLNVVKICKGLDEKDMTKNEALPSSPRAWFPSSPRRLGSLRYSGQGCLSYHDYPVINSLWMHRNTPDPVPEVDPLRGASSIARIHRLR